MKLDILDASKNKVGEIELPLQFNEEIRADLVNRAILAVHSSNKSPYGAMPKAGKRASAIISKRRRDYRLKSNTLPKK